MFEWLGSPEFIGATLGLTGMNSIATNIFNYGKQKEAFDYQKALNERIFEREDTAIQRRMADAAAAGVNPYSVLGQGAQSGGKVSGPVAPQLKSGVLDALSTGMDLYSNLVQTQKQKVDTENAIKSGLVLDADLAQKLGQNKILGLEADMAQLALNEQALNQLDYLYNFNSYYGTNFHFLKSDNNSNSIYKDFGIFDNKNALPDVFKYSLNESNLADIMYHRNSYEIPNRQYDLLEQQVEQSKINTDLLRKENNWYNWNQGLNFGTSIINSALGFLNFGQKQTFNSLQYGLNSRRLDLDSSKFDFDRYKYYDSISRKQRYYY